MEIHKAYVLIIAEIGEREYVKQEVEKMPEVKEVFLVSGPWDIVAKFEAATMVKLKEAITWKVRRVPKVRSTLIMIVKEED